MAESGAEYLRKDGRTDGQDCCLREAVPSSKVLEFDFEGFEKL